MIATTVGNFLSVNERDKKDSTEKWYIFTFLDDVDKSHDCYISKEVYEKIKSINFNRYEQVSITLNVYLGKNGWNFSPIEVEKIPFDNKNSSDKQGNKKTA